MEGSLSAYCINLGAHLPPVRLPRPASRDSKDSSGTAHSSETSFVVGSAPDCDYVIDQRGWEPRHLRFSWNWRFSTWELENLSASLIYTDNQPVPEGQKLPLLLWETNLRSEGVILKFKRTPDAPRYKGEAVSKIPLTDDCLTIGRGLENKAGSTGPRLALDPDILSISSTQAEIRRSGADYIIVNRNSSGSGRTIVNGDQNFDERKLVLGDCIQIPNCDYYTFKFTGDALRHLGRGGALQGLGLTVDVKSGLRILNPVNIELRRGGFLGIIGGSGQGKSTLMNSLCGIMPATAGKVVVDGMVLRSPGDVARAGIGYVPQDDIVHKELTVEQALHYAACLRLKATPSQIQNLLETTMDTLRLTEHRHKNIVNLSGGQRKRVSIASELLVSPDYIFLDEPTSGLDPQTERSLMGELSVLAGRKRIGVACTTHVLQNCHVLTRLAFISRGRLIFHGKPVDAVRFFLYAGSLDEAQNRSAQGTATDSGFSSDDPSEESGEFAEVQLLDKVSNIYDIAQDTTKPVAQQNKEAEQWEKNYQASPYYEPPMREEDAATAEAPHVPPQVGVLRSLSLLISRQWTILISSKLNYLFLTAQAVVIGLLISWVDNNPVLQMFLGLIATLWFGCSNGAQQIVGELAIFRRERLAGLGIHTYLLSKFAFLAAITGIQAMIVCLMILGGSVVLHRDHTQDLEQPKPDFTGHVPDKATREFRKAFFEKEWNSLAAGIDSHDGDAAAPAASSTAAPKAADNDFNIVGLDVDENNKPLEKVQQPKATRVYVNPTGLHVKDFQYRLLEKLAWFFRMRENVIDGLAVHPVMLEPGQSRILIDMEQGSISWKLFVMNILCLRLGALMAAALVGVALGLVVSSLVDTPTQAVMWVPLILIPQILFGSFVVIVPEMDTAVLYFSRALPSFNLQRVMDVGQIYGRSAPRMTNQSKIPVFLSNPPNENEIVEWDGRQTSYDKVSEVNKSWQNLVVFRKWLGAREKITNSKPGQPPMYVDSIEERRDSAVRKGDRYLSLKPAQISATVLGGWVAGCYLIAVVSLYRRQTGR